MERPRAAALRSAPEKKGVGIRKGDPLDLENFVTRWRDELMNRGAAWDGARAVAELEKKGVYEFLSGESKSAPKWQANDLLRRVVEEMVYYRTEVTGRRAAEYFDDFDEFLRRVITKIQKQEAKASISSLKSLLKGLRAQAERTIKTAASLKLEEKNRNFGVWQHLWPRLPRNNLVSKKRELDSRLQIELGKKFADYLRQADVSLETIARLIYLAYWIGGFCSQVEDGTVKTPAGGILKVRNIRENLRAAGLHNRAAFMPRQK
jgi:hypothetical protein